MMSRIKLYKILLLEFVQSVRVFSLKQYERRVKYLEPRSASLHIFIFPLQEPELGEYCSTGAASCMKRVLSRRTWNPIENLIVLPFPLHIYKYSTPGNNSDCLCVNILLLISGGGLGTTNNAICINLLHHYCREKTFYLYFKTLLCSV